MKKILLAGACVLALSASGAMAQNAGGTSPSSPNTVQPGSSGQVSAIALTAPELQNRPASAGRFVVSVNGCESLPGHRSGFRF